MFACGGDSHSTNGGAFGCYMAGFGAIEMTGVVVTGEIWMPVPDTIRVNWSARSAGRRGEGHHAVPVPRTRHRQRGRVIEYGGDTVAAMSMNERVVLTNMAAELGAETGIVEPDDTTLDAIRAAGREPAADALDWRSDADAEYAISRLRCGGARTADRGAAFAGELRRGRRVTAMRHRSGLHRRLRRRQTQRSAHGAEVLRGRRSRSGTRLLIAPASQRVIADAAADGTLQALTDAGAYLLPTGCGACAALGAGILAEDEVCISSTNRNFRGRMGANSSQVYLGSPYSVAAAAVAGRITDPREFLA